MVTIAQTSKPEEQESLDQPQENGGLESRPVVTNNLSRSIASEDNPIDNDFFVPKDDYQAPPVEDQGPPSKALTNDFYTPIMDTATAPEQNPEKAEDSHILTYPEFNSVFNRMQMTQESVAKVYALHKKTGVNPDFIADRVDEFEKLTADTGADVNKIMAKSKALQRYAAKDPTNFPFLKKDAKHLYTLDKLINDNFTKNRLSDEIAEINKKVQDGIPLSRRDISVRNGLRNHLNRLNRVDSELSTEQRLAGIAASGTAQAGTSIVESLPYIAGGAVTGLGTGAAYGFAFGGVPGALVSGLAMGGTGATAGAALGAFKNSQPKEFSGLYEYLSQLKDENGKPLNEKEVIEAAKIGSYFNAAIEAGGDAATLALALGGTLAAGTALAAGVQQIKKTAGNKAKQFVATKIAKQMATAAGRSALLRGGINLLSEGAQEGIQQAPEIILEEKLKKESGRKFAPNEQTPTERVKEAAIAGVVGSAIPTGLGFGSSYVINRQMGNFAKDFEEAYISNLLKNDINKANAEVKAKDLSPDKAAELYHEVARDSEIKHATVSVEKFHEIAEAKGLDPRQEAIKLAGDDGTTYDTAVESGGDIRIPIENYMAHVAGKQEMQELDKNIKLGDSPFTFEEVAKMADEAIKDIDVEQKQETVYDLFSKEAQNATDPITAHHIATIVEARYNRRAERLSTPENKVNAVDLYKQDNIQVQESADLRGGLYMNKATKKAAAITAVVASIFGATSQRQKQTTTEQGVPTVVTSIKPSEAQKSIANEYLPQEEVLIEEEVLPEGGDLPPAHTKRTSDTISEPSYIDGDGYLDDSTVTALAESLIVIEGGKIPDGELNDSQVEAHEIQKERIREIARNGDIKEIKDSGNNESFFGNEELGWFNPKTYEFYDSKEDILDKDSVGIELYQGKSSAVLGTASVSAMGALVRLGNNVNVSTFLHEMAHVFFHHEVKDFQAISKIEGRSSTQEQFLVDMKNLQDWYVSYGGAKAFKEVQSFAKDANKKAKETKLDIDKATAEYADAVVKYIEQLADKNGIKTGDVMDEAARTFGVNIPNENLRLFVMRPYHEMFARGSEKYFAEGKAPSSSLGRAFQYFRRFAIQMYKSLRNIDINLSKEVREYFDRLYVVDEKVTQYQNLLGLEATSPELDLMKLTPEQRDRIEKLFLESNVHIDQMVYRQVKADMEKEEAYRKSQARNDIETLITQEVYAESDYVASSLITTGKMPDGTTPDGFVRRRPSKKEIIAKYGKGVLDALPRGFAVDKGGYELDVVADQHQYKDGDHLINSMLKLPPMDEEIQRRTEEELDATYESTLTPQAIDDTAKEATHSASSQAILRAKYEYAIKNHPEAFKDLIRQIPRIPNDSQLAIVAATRMSNMRISDIRPNAFLATERRHAKEAAQAATKGDWEQYASSKGKQIVAHAMFKAAQQTKKLIDKRLTQIEPLYANEANLHTKRNLDLVYTARALLTGIGLMKKSAKTEEQIQYIKEYDPDLFIEMQDVLSEYGSGDIKSFKQVRYGEFDAVTNASLALWDKARTDYLLDVEGKDQERDTALFELSDSFGRFTPAKQKKVKSKKGRSKERDITQGASLRRQASIAESIDGGFGGAYHKYVYLPVKRALDGLYTMRGKYLSQIDELIQENIKSFKDNKLYEIPEIQIDGQPVMWSKTQMLAIRANMGTESNLRKMEKNGFVTVKDGVVDSSRLEAAFNKLETSGIFTAKDMHLVQAFLNILDEMKPQLQDAYKKNNGRYMGEIPPKSIKSIHGTFKGGYYPVVYDRQHVDFVEYVKSLEEQGINVKELQSGNSFDHFIPSKNISATKERTELTIAPLDLDISNFTSHVDLVMRYINLAHPVRQTHKLVNSAEFRSMAERYYGDLVDGTIIPWLDRTLYQKSTEYDQSTAAISRLAKDIMKAASAQYLIMNTSNMAQQVTGGLSVASGILGTKGTLYLMKNAHNGAFSMRKELILESPFMNNRILNTAREAAKNIYGIEDDASFADKVINIGFFPQAYLQHRVDMIVWLSAYDLAISKDMEHKDAMDFADVTVEKSQGHFAPESMSNLEAGSQLMKLMLQFYPYMNMKYNVLANIYANSKAKKATNVQIHSASTVWAFSMAFVVETVLDTATRLLIKKTKLSDAEWKEWSDEDQDGWKIDDFTKILGINLARNIVGTNPWAGIAGQAAVGMATKGNYDDAISLPTFRIIESTVAGVASIEKLIERNTGLYLMTDKEFNNKDVQQSKTDKQIRFERRQMAEALGTLMKGLPVGPLVDAIQTSSAILDKNKK